MIKHERAEVDIMKYLMNIVRGNEIRKIPQGLTFYIIALTEPPKIVTIDEIRGDEEYLILIPVSAIEELLEKSEEKGVEKAEEVKEEKEEKLQLKRRTIERLIQKIFWSITSTTNLPFEIVDTKINLEDDIIKINLILVATEKGKIGFNVIGAARFLSSKMLEEMKKVRLVLPILLTVNSEGKSASVLVDIVIDEMIRSILLSHGLNLKDYVIVYDPQNDMLIAHIFAEKTEGVSMGMFSGYPIAEEIAKIIKSRLKWQGPVKVRLKIGIFDYVKTL